MSVISNNKANLWLITVYKMFPNLKAGHCTIEFVEGRCYQIQFTYHVHQDWIIKFSHADRTRLEISCNGQLHNYWDGTAERVMNTLDVFETILKKSGATCDLF